MGKLRALLLATAILIPAGGVGEDFPIPYRDSDRCPVCNMFVAKYPDWVAAILFNDGNYKVFDGPKDMFHYYLHMEDYDPGRDKEEIEAIIVKEYYNLRPIDARKAFFVIGSDVIGPMGRELIPFDSREAAEEFMEDHRGKRVLTFDEIDEGLVERLREGETMLPW